MSVRLAFSTRTDCPVPSIPAITGNLISSCTIFPVPTLPELHCPISIHIPPPVIPPPPSFNYGCYKPRMEVTMGYNFCNLQGSTHVVTSYTPGGPPNSLHAGVVGCSVCATSGVNSGVSFPNMSETGYCEPMFKIDLKLPCVSVKIKPGDAFWSPPEGDAYAGVKGGKTIIVTRSSIIQSCDYSFKLQTLLNCPCLDGIDGNVYSGDGDLKITTHVTPTYTSELCYYQIYTDLVLGLTACFDVVCDIGAEGSQLIISKRCLKFNAGVLYDDATCKEAYRITFRGVHIDPPTGAGVGGTCGTACDKNQGAAGASTPDDNCPDFNGFGFNNNPPPPPPPPGGGGDLSPFG